MSSVSGRAIVSNILCRRSLFVAPHAAHIRRPLILIEYFLMYPESASKLSAYSCIGREAPPYSTGRRYYCYSCIALDSTPPTSLFSLSHPEPAGPFHSLLFSSCLVFMWRIHWKCYAPLQPASSVLFCSLLFSYILFFLFCSFCSSARHELQAVDSFSSQLRTAHSMKQALQAQALRPRMRTFASRFPISTLEMSRVDSS